MKLKQNMGSFILLEKETKQIPFRFILLGSEKYFLTKPARLPWNRLKRLQIRALTK
jgi:hypothetical protein